MHQILVSLTIDKNEFMRLYQGSARTVVTRATDGRTVRFPANILRPFLLHNGISGTFRITFNDEGKYQGIEKLS